MKFILIMIWLNNTQPLTVGPFETEKLCVDGAAMLFAKWKNRYIAGDFICIPTYYEKEEK